MENAGPLPAGTIGLRAWQREASFRNLWVKTGKESRSLWRSNRRRKECQTSAACGGRPIRQRCRAQGHGLPSVTDHPFAGAQSQHVTFTTGDGEWGVENQGLNRWGMNFVKGAVQYEGYVWVRADKTTELVAALESRDGSRSYAETRR